MTNESGFVVDQWQDPGTKKFTTNYFQCYDLALTNGLNRITVWATDLAGNLTTITTNLTLDYSGDTTPPVISLIWPQDGMALSGTSFYMRGKLNDETAQITAQVVDASSTAHVVTGIVERNGMFWAEDLPLAAGNNTVTLTATDAAGNISTTSLTLTKSSVVLSITPSSIPEGDQLYQSTVNDLLGTVTPGYNVTVNGVSATVDGSGNWTANGVPVNGQGTATFDAVATAASGSPPAQVNSSLQKEKEAMLTISYHHTGKNVNFEDDVGDYGLFTREKTYNAGYVEDTSGNWIFYKHGTVNDYSEDQSQWFASDYDWTTDSQSAHFESSYGALSNNDHILEFFESVTCVPDKDVSVAGWAGQAGVGNGYPPIFAHHYYADGIQAHYEYNDGFGSEVDANIGSETKMTLYTGGKSGVDRRNLFRIHATATRYGAPPGAPWDDMPMKLVKPKDIQVMGKTPGSDGYLWIALPDNAEPELNLRVPSANHYDAKADQQKYRLFVQANSQLLQPNRVARGADFIVGEFINFSPVWSPPLPEEPQKSPNLWHVDGIVMNCFTNAIQGGWFPASSDVYFLDRESLTREVLTNCWWVSGGTNDNANTPAIYNAIFAEGLTFNNGQYVAVDARGKFNMYRPQGKISPVTTSVHINGPNLQFYDLYTSPYYGITFFNEIVVPAGFSGQRLWAQIIPSTTRIHKDVNGIDHKWICNGAGPYGDLPTPWGYFSPFDTNAPVDHPPLPLLSSHYVSAFVSEEFKMWMMFRPNGGQWVPLRTVNWFWTGHATNSPTGWGLESSDHSVNPSDSDTQTYPLWRSDVDNFHWDPAL